ncbi:hypothetical protein PLICRDRAFT_45090 [Plicaturopsis crispa FD-325 SS-3]|nr:hypothetical protein PLICRDRAFT_45090 [Plicaturopsis crispa FD-325 SS-3]
MRESMLPRERRKRDGSCKSLGYRTGFFDRYVVFQLDHGTGWVFRLTSEAQNDERRPRLTQKVPSFWRTIRALRLSSAETEAA